MRLGAPVAEVTPVTFPKATGTRARADAQSPRWKRQAGDRELLAVALGALPEHHPGWSPARRTPQPALPPNTMPSFYADEVTPGLYPVTLLLSSALLVPSPLHLPARSWCPRPSPTAARARPGSPQTQLRSLRFQLSQPSLLSLYQSISYVPTLNRFSLLHCSHFLDLSRLHQCKTHPLWSAPSYSAPTLWVCFNTRTSLLHTLPPQFCHFVPLKHHVTLYFTYPSPSEVFL